MVNLSISSWILLDSLNTLLFFISTFLFIPKLISKNNIILSIFSSLALGFIDILFTNASLILIPLVYFELYSLSKIKIKNRIKILILLFSFFISSITQSIANYFVAEILNLHFNTNTLKTLLSVTLMTIINYFLTIIIIILLKELLNKKKFKLISQNGAIIKIVLLSITIITISYLSLSLISRYHSVQLTYFRITILIILISITSMIIGSITLIIGYMKELKSNYENRHLKERNLYIKELERKNTELRRFKHDYKNLLTSLSVSLRSNSSDNDSIQRLLDYADSNVDMTSTVENANLYHLNDDLVKGIIVTKLVAAKNKHIETNFEVDKNIFIPKRLSVEVTRILGILFDNGIEASLLNSHPKMNFALVSFDNYLEFILENNVSPNEDINLNQISKTGYTSKKGHNGLGLSTVKEIIHANSDLLLQTKIKDGYFSTILTVLEDK